MPRDSIGRLPEISRGEDAYLHGWLSEEFQNLAQSGGEGGDFFLGVVEVKARAGGAGETEFFHERHVAVVTTAKGYSLLIGDGDDVVGVDPLEGETPVSYTLLTLPTKRIV